MKCLFSKCSVTEADFNPGFSSGNRDGSDKPQLLTYEVRRAMTNWSEQIGAMKDGQLKQYFAENIISSLPLWNWVISPRADFNKYGINLLFITGRNT